MDRKILILLAGLTVLFTRCNTVKCLPFKHKWIVSKYLSNNYEDIEETLSLNKDNTYEYLYVVKKKPIVKINGIYSINTQEDPNGVIRVNIDIDDLKENNFINVKDYEIYKKNKKAIIDLYYFDSGEFNEFLNPEKFVWGCNQLLRDYDHSGDFNRID